MNRIITFFCCLMPCIVLAGGFGGSIDVNGSYNFIKSHNENIDLTLNYDTTRWYIHTDISGGHKNWATETEKLSANGTKEFWNHVKSLSAGDIIDAVTKGYITKADYEFKKNDKRNWNAGAGIEFGIHITPKDDLSAYLRYDYFGSKNLSFTDNEKLAVKGDFPDIRIDTLIGHQDETVKTTSHQIDTYVHYKHYFNIEGRTLWAKVTSFMKFDFENKDRSLHNDKNVYFRDEKHYQSPTNTNDLNYLYQIYYEDSKSLFKAPGLTGALGIDVKQNNDMDFFWRKDYIDGKWVDDKTKEQGYWYYSLAIEPVIRLNYSIYKFDFGVENRLQWYIHALNPQMMAAKYVDSLSFKKNEWRDMIKAYVAYKPADRHKIQATYSRDIIRPGYDKLTNMVKVGNTESEYFVGNSDLKPQINNAVDLKYTYTFKQNFELYALLKYTHMRDKAEKVVDNKDDGITYYTYINAGLQQRASVRVDLKGRWKRFFMELYAQTNAEFISYKDNVKADKTTINYELYADLRWTLPKGWGINLKGGYASRKESAYSAKDSYIQTNLRITKTFINRLELYLEGRDLGDFPEYEYTWNKTLDYCKITQTSNHRISLAVGLKYKF